MLNIRILVAFLVATTISNTTLLTNSFRIVTTTSIHPPPIIAIRHHQQQHDPTTTTTTTSTRLYQRPLTAMYYGNDDAATTSTTMTLLEEVIRNIRVQEIDDSIDILHMPVFGSSDHGDTNHHSHHHSHHHHNHHLNYYPIASMMQGSAGYIAQHAGSIAVFHLPEEQPDSVLRDIGLCYLLGLKIILVVSTDCYHHHQQHTNGPKSLRQMEETLGYLRTEVERKLNRFLCMDQHVSTTHGNGKDRPNVVSGNNFCTGQRFSPDAIAGKATHVSSYKIQQSLHQNDNILVLTNVILDKTGDDWVCTDGCQLASKVAVELQASKLILLRNTPKLLTFNDEHVQDIPLSLAKAILEAQVGGGDSATSRESHDGGESALTTTLPPPDAFWRELHWAAYAVEKGTSRAHLVNAPLDGALLEELFTAVNGANTCLYHDDELLQSHNNNNNKTVKNHHPSKAAMTYSDFVPSPRNEDKNNEEDLYYYERRRDNHIRYF